MVNLIWFGILTFLVQFKITSWTFTFLSDFIKNLLLNLPLKKYIGAGAGPKIFTFLNNGADFNNSDEKVSNFLSNLDDNMIDANLANGGILAFCLDVNSLSKKGEAALCEAIRARLKDPPARPAEGTAGSAIQQLNILAAAALKELDFVERGLWLRPSFWTCLSFPHVIQWPDLLRFDALQVRDSKSIAIGAL